MGASVVLFDWGLGNLLFGILVFAWGIYPGQNDFVKDMGMIWTIFGVVLLLGGWQVMRIAWFPIIFLVCAIPWPQLVYSRVAGPLQELAAKAAVLTLKMTGVTAAHSGTKIYVDVGAAKMRALDVAEACAGLRSLMTFIAVAGAVGFLSTRALWQKLVITFSAIPIAIFCNVMRVAGMGLLDRYVSQKLSESFAHQFVGLIMLIPAFFMILLVGWILDNVFVETADVRRLARKHAPVIKERTARRELEDDLVIEVRRKTTTSAAPVVQAKSPAVAARPPAAVKTAPAKSPPPAAPLRAESTPTLRVAAKPVTKTPIANAVSAAPKAVAPKATTPAPISRPAPATLRPAAQAPPARPAPANPAAKPNDLAEATKRLTASRSLRPANSAPSPAQGAAKPSTQKVNGVAAAKVPSAERQPVTAATARPATQSPANSPTAIRTTKPQVTRTTTPAQSKE